MFEFVCLFFSQITVENSPEAVPNGHIFAMRHPDVETNNLPITPSRSFSPQKKPDSNGYAPGVTKDITGADSVPVNGEVTMENASPITSPKRSEKSGMIGRQNIVVKDNTDAGALWLNGDVTPATSRGSVFEKKSEPSAVNRHHDVVPVEAKEVAKADAASSHLFYKKKIENLSVNRNQEVVPVEPKNVAKADEVQQNGDASSHLIYKKKSENIAGVNRYHEVVPAVLKVMVEGNEVWQNGTIATETNKLGPLTKNHERETQIKTLRIEDDDDDLVEERKPLPAENASEDQDSGAEMFASSRPHAWHHKLAKKSHETLADSSLSRQVYFIMDLIFYVADYFVSC